MSSIPVSGRWSQTRPGRIEVDFPAAPFVAIFDDGGGHVTVALFPQQAEQTRAVLNDLLTISEGSDQ